MKRGHGVARDATVRCTPLRAGWERDPSDDQRDRGETLHGNILRLFGIVGWLVGWEDRALTKTIEEKGPVRSREDYSGAKTSWQQETGERIAHLETSVLPWNCPTVRLNVTGLPSRIIPSSIFVPGAIGLLQPAGRFRC